jgi:hypothetical protein
VRAEHGAISLSSLLSSPINYEKDIFRLAWRINNFYPYRNIRIIDSQRFCDSIGTSSFLFRRYFFDTRYHRYHIRN